MYLIEKRCTIPVTNKINKERIRPSESILNPHPLIGIVPVDFQPNNKSPIKVNPTPIVGMFAQVERFEKQSTTATIPGVIPNAK